MSAPKKIEDLVKNFESHIDDYKSGNLNETELRVQYLNPFFEALGWDVTNKQGYAEAYKDVIHEDAIKIGSLTKAPDYCFRIGIARKFFLEAKKPSINIKDDVNPAYQLRRYAWSAKLPLSILSDFEEFAIYDCRIKPEKNDKSSTARILYFTYKDYCEKWDEIVSIFSKEAVLKGSFDKYSDSTKSKRGTAEVDSAFLKDIEIWREVLAQNIALRNKELGTRELNYAVQQTIDRIIFLRICEDRGIEPYGQLAALLNGTNAYGRLCEYYKKADQKYNSGLFHFSKEKDRHEEPDALTLNINIDDKPLKEIFKGLYYPDSPYEFSVLSSDILGQVYEQFLGKVIHLTSSHKAVIEDKPEVKKAGGVFYTPTYIVDYIVKDTVGKILEGKTIKEAEKIKILDPACGSGSFLIGAYQYLMNWFRDKYIEEGDTKNAKAKKIYQTRFGGWRLTTQEKKKILLNNIYGVDIDSQAVEVTKLSLLLKVLEGESEETLANQLKLFHERVLPDLGNNIKCGNSLIGSDFYQGKQLNLLSEDEQRRINTFDWDKEFAEIFSGKNPGFDIAIGNPPYIRIQAMKEWAPVEVEFYKERYKSASKGNYDVYVVFVERGLELLNKNGNLGFILPHKFFNAEYGFPLREIISAGKHLSKVVNFGDYQIFKGATTYTCLMFLSKKENNECMIQKVSNIITWLGNEGVETGNVDVSKISGSEWNFTVGRSSSLFEKIESLPHKLSNLANNIFQGLITGADPVFILEKRDERKYFSYILDNLIELEDELLHPLCKGSLNIKRYSVENINKYILFPYVRKDKRQNLLGQEEIKEKYPYIWKYLTLNKKVLESREKGKWKHDKWYSFGRTQNLNEMETKKILTPSIASFASFTLDKNGDYYFVGSGGGGGGGYGIHLKEEFAHYYEYILCLLNSKLLDFHLKQISSKFRGGYYAYNKQYIEKLPIRLIDISNSKEKSRHDEIVSLVDSMLSLNKKLQEARTSHDKTLIQRQIETTDKEIDRLVYELYDLTPDEIKIVEESCKR